MKKNKNKQILAFLLIVTIIVSAAFAWLTATDSKENVFTVGNVNIKLYEDDWEEFSSGKYKRTDNANCNMEPGATIEKAPYIENTGDNAAWTYIVVSIPTAEANDVYLKNGKIGLLDNELSIKVTGYAIQKGYHNLDDAEKIWHDYFDNIKTERLGYENTGNNVDKLLELFTLNDIGAEWTLIDDPYISTDGHTYYTYSYGLLDAANTTSKLFENVTLLDSIGTEDTFHVTFAGYYERYDTETLLPIEESFVECPKTFTWEEIVNEVDADIYKYGSKSFVQTNSSETGLIESLKALDSSDEVQDFSSKVSYNKIGYGAFLSTAITEASIPSGLKTIGLASFAFCPKLSNVDIPNSVSIISAAAFYGDSVLTQIILPKNITSVEPMSFAYCENLSKIEFGKNITEIKDMAFVGNNLGDVIIPDTVQSISMLAFIPKDNRITTITLSSSLQAKTVSVNAFGDNTIVKYNNITTNNLTERLAASNDVNSIYYDDTDSVAELLN